MPAASGSAPFCGTAWCARVNGALVRDVGHLKLLGRGTSINASKSNTIS